MVNKCIICRVNEVKGRNGPFHRIPKDPMLRQSWLKALNLTQVKEWDRVCGAHFHSTDYWPHREKVQPLLKPKAVPFLKVYAAEEGEFQETDRDDNATPEFDAPESPYRECYANQMLDASMHIGSPEPFEYVAAGSSKSNFVNSSDEEYNCDERIRYDDKRCYRSELPVTTGSDLQLEDASSSSSSLLFNKKQQLQAIKIKFLEDTLRQLRTRIKKQDDRMKELERRLDETEYLRDMLKLA